MAKIISSLPGSAGILSRTSQLINDGSDATSTYVETDELGTTAFSNSYNDLDDLPIIGDGVTNLSYISSPTQGTVTSDTGTSAIIPLADVTNAGLLSSAEKAEIATALQPSDISGLVPYTGATTDVDLGEYQLKTGQLELDQTPTGTFSTAKIRWNDTAGTAEIRLKGNSVTLQLGQELVKRVVNKTTTNITLQESNYQVVRIIGATGQRLSVDLAQADSEANSASTLGLVTENIANNQEGFITFSGEINLINTTGSLQGETWVDGDVLYLSPTVAGQLTKIAPTAPNHTVRVCYVQYAHATQGKLHVDVDRGYSLENLHNVKITATTVGKILGSTTEGLWENKSVAEILGYTPENAANKTDSYTTSSSTAYVSGKALVEGLAIKNWIKSNESLSLAQRKGDILYGILDQYTGEEITLSKVVGTPTVDGIIYFQLGSEYFKRVFDENINVKWFGAKGDNLTNNTSVLSNIFNNSAIRGISIYFPNGIYITDGNTLFSNTIIVGESINSTVIKLKSEAVTTSRIINIPKEVNNVSISNITLDVNATDISKELRAIQIEGYYNNISTPNNLYNFIFNKIKFINSSQFDIYINGYDNKINKIKIENCEFYNSFKGSIFMRAVEDVSIKGNKFIGWGSIDNYRNAISFQGAPSVNSNAECRNINISDNTFENTNATKFAIEAYNCFFISCIISNNIFINKTTNTTGNVAGAMSLSPFDTLISNNTIVNWRGGAMELGGLESGYIRDSKTIVSNNILNNSGINVAALRGIIISSNNIKRDGFGINAPCITLGGAALYTDRPRDIHIVGNSIDITNQGGNSSAILIASSGAANTFASDVRIISNSFKRNNINTYSFIKFSNDASLDIENITISENTFFDSEVVTASAIYFINNNLQNVSIINNDFTTVTKPFSTGYESYNLTIFGNRYTDSGGFFEVQKGISIKSTPIDSTGTYDLLSRNTSTGVVEKITAIPQSLVTNLTTDLAAKAPLASPTFTGTPLAPTATAGTNTTQIATTAFVQENVGENTYWTKTGNNIANNNSGIVTAAGMRFGNIGGNVFADFNRYGQDISFILGNPWFQTTNIAINNATGGVLSSTSKLFLTANGISSIEVESTNVKLNVPIRLKNYTVATLPTGTQGNTAYVTDATAPTYLGTLTGGGSVVCPVFYNGTSWVAH